VAGGAPQQSFNYLKRDFPDVSPAGVELLNQLLTFDPRKRLALDEATRHAWFCERPFPRPPEAMPRFPSSHAPPPDGTLSKRQRN
jgi:serine/threonine protein kinase